MSAIDIWPYTLVEMKALPYLIKIQIKSDFVKWRTYKRKEDRRIINNEYQKEVQRKIRKQDPEKYIEQRRYYEIRRREMELNKKYVL